MTPCSSKDFKAIANEEELLRRKNCAQGAYAFGQFQKLFLLSRRRFFVLNICYVGENKDTFGEH